MDDRSDELKHPRIFFELSVLPLNLIRPYIVHTPWPLYPAAIFSIIERFRYRCNLIEGFIALEFVNIAQLIHD